MAKHDHKWWVFSTAFNDGVLMLYCKCGDYGIVRNPSKEEWSRAFYAPSNEYRWYEPDRVEIIPDMTTAIHPTLGIRTRVPG